MSHAYQPNVILTTSILLLMLIVLILLIFIVVGLYQTYKIEHSVNQAKFRHGTVPEPLPHGFYKGTAPKSIRGTWQGKLFDRARQSGINQFSDSCKFPFKTYRAKGLRDSRLTVLRIDYNQLDNSWWLRLIVDEIVETSPGHYLGKVHLNFIPGLPFTVAYFELSHS